MAFLNARLDEDEAAALSGSPLSAPLSQRWETQRIEERVPGAGLRPIATWAVVTALGYEAIVARTSDIAPRVSAHVARHDPERVLAGVRAKRKIVAMHRFSAGSWPPGDWIRVLRLLATEYEQHPEYQREWRP